MRRRTMAVMGGLLVALAGTVAPAAHAQQRPKTNADALRERRGQADRDARRRIGAQLALREIEQAEWEAVAEILQVTPSLEIVVGEFHLLPTSGTAERRNRWRYSRLFDDSFGYALEGRWWMPLSYRSAWGPFARLDYGTFEGMPTLDAAGNTFQAEYLRLTRLMVGVGVRLQSGLPYERWCWRFGLHAALGLAYVEGVDAILDRNATGFGMQSVGLFDPTLTWAADIRMSGGVSFVFFPRVRVWFELFVGAARMGGPHAASATASAGFDPSAPRRMGATTLGLSITIDVATAAPTAKGETR